MPSTNPFTPGPKAGPKKNSPPFTPVNKAKLDKIVRLPGFKFDRKHLFLPYYRDAIYPMLGALTTTGREGRQATVLRRVTIIYRNAIHTHRLYPTYNLESPGFWAAVLSDVRKEAPQITEGLNVPVLMNIVSVYTQGYAEEQSEKDGEKSSGEDTELDVTKPSKASTDPKKILLPLVRAWAKLFRKHLAKKQQKTLESVNGSAQTAAVYPPRLPKETASYYITRLRIRIEDMAKEIASLKQQQDVADEHNDDRFNGLYATLDRTDAKLKEAESEARLTKLGVGTGEDDPWVPWREYEAHLGILADRREEGEGEGDAVGDNGEGICGFEGDDRWMGPGTLERLFQPGEA